eukprot:Nk52_evm18s352 gene=Nk52_evmTU18s352
MASMQKGVTHTAQQVRALRLYKNLLKNSRSWIIDTALWRDEALDIRERFDNNKGVRDPVLIEKLISDGEAYLTTNMHPDPYKQPTAPEGSKWERNIPPPKIICELNDDEKEWLRQIEGQSSASGHGH